jgi:anaerobic ribonucleoside-triphosphate reductase
MFNSVARAKIVESKHVNRNKYRLVCAFNVTDTYEVFGMLKFKFPVQAKCNYVSGDFYIHDLDKEIARAKRHLRTERIEFTKEFPASYEGDDSVYTFVSPRDLGMF